MSNERVIPVSSPAEVVTKTILINGTAIPDIVGVTGIQVAKEVNRIAFAKLMIRDGSASDEDFSISSGDLFVPGNEIEIHAGYSSDEKVLFKGIITKHGLKSQKNGSSVLRVECRDKAYKMTLNRNSRYFHDLADSDVFEQLVGDYGLTADIEQTPFTNPRLVQVHATDWDFLLSRAEVCNKLVLVDDGAVSLKTPDLTADPALSLTYGANILEFEAEMDGRNQYSGVNAKSWDSANQEVLESETSDEAGGEQGNIAAADLSGSVGVENFNLVHAGQLKADELQSWADSRLFRSKLAKIKGRVSFQGFADIKPGQMIELKGLGDRFNGNALVSAVSHDISQGGWISHVQFGLGENWFGGHFNEVMDKPASALQPGVNGLQTGIVTALAGDPDGEHRIRVKIPVISIDDDGIWARVATLDAGNNRGTFFLPEIGDEVIVGFLNDDPRDAIVLGMLNSSAKPAAFEASDENHEKGYVSRDGLKVVFNDDEKSISLTTPAGNSLVLSEKEGAISIKDENGNSIVLDRAGITLESAKDIILKASGDLKIEGTNIEIGANAQLKASGSASAEYSSSGSTTVKGGIVQIN